jgi:hypothetical protein
MCNRRYRDLQRSLSTLAEPFGADVVLIEPTRGNHIRAVITAGAVSFTIYMAHSPGDFRSGRNVEAFVRRRLRALAGRAPA